MRRFLQDNTAYAFQPPAEFQDDFGDLCSKNDRFTVATVANVTAYM